MHDKNTINRDSAGPDRSDGAMTEQRREGASPSGAAAGQADMLANRLRKRFRHLKKWARRTGTDVFRLYDRDIPEIPLVLDWYGGALIGALYKRPYEKDAAEEDRWINVMAEAAAEALGITGDRVFIRYRERQRGKAQYGRFGETRVVAEVREGGLRFQVNLSDYLDTGLFPDLRRLRAHIREEAAGKRVLNLFCYTASFSVYAAAGGAAEIDSVDLSNTYLDWGLENFRLNGFPGKRVSREALLAHQSPVAPLPPFRFIRADARLFLAEAGKARRLWDRIILDPPAFSNSKKMAGVLDLRRDYGGLVRSALRLLAPGGRLWFSANARHFRFDPEEFRNAEFPGLRMEDIKDRLTDEDFRGKKIPRCYLFQV
jgi:23S rRNA G2069 N7-methylase RlmK/C1962 C5-methylase RlmI